MQVVQAGQHKYIWLELDPNVLADVARQAGFQCQVEELKRALAMSLSTPGRKAPLLLFDASDPGNLGWFSRCQFYVDGQTGQVLQTPLVIGNCRDRNGYLLRDAVRLQVMKELPVSFRLPRHQPVTEQMVYALVYNFLHALLNVGVGVCGGPVVKPLAGRTESVTRG
ncbi:MAG: hypothetical protein ACP5U2_08125 [Bryobacteraceae bacterium]